MKQAIAAVLLAAGSSVAITLDTSNTTSITSAAKTIASRIVSTYNGSEPGEVPGLFPTPYYFWEAGLAWDSLINYWALTGDTTYNDLVSQALVWQVGPNDDYMPLNQTKSLGNDDQSFWALAAMTAAEYGFPAPVGLRENITWAQLAENVFNEQALRWDVDTCAGGLRWQIFTFNSGYNYKNALSNGNFYQLAARLALYTGNSTYSDWAEKVIEWSLENGLLDKETGLVYDGFDVTDCSAVNHIAWTASTGTYLSGASYLQNYSTILRNSAAPFLLIVGLNYTFTQNNVLYEQACETSDNCNVDQLAFKAIASRSLARVRDLTPDSETTLNGTDVGTIHERMDWVIQASAKAAAAQCSGGDDGSVCGSSWLNGTWDGSEGLGQDLSALEIILATLPGKELRNANSSASTSVTSGNSTSTSATSGSSTTSRGSQTTSSSTATGSVVASTGGADSISGSVVGLTFAVGLAVVAFAV